MERPEESKHNWLAKTLHARSLAQLFILYLTFTSAEARIHDSYLSFEYSCPKRIFCLTEAENIHGSCEAYAKLPGTVTLPFLIGSSPSMAISKDDCKKEQTQCPFLPGTRISETSAIERKTSTLSQRKGRAPQPSNTFSSQARGWWWGGGLHDDTYMTPLGRFDLQSRCFVCTFPAPTGPTTANNSPGITSKLMLFKTACCVL